MDNESGINRLKVISYNIWFSAKQQYERLISLLETINKHDADIICLQEVVPEIYNYIKLCQKKDYPNIYPNKIDQEYDCVILSKHPFTITNEHLFKNSTMGRKLIYVTIDMKIIKIVEKEDNIDFIVKNYNLTIGTTHCESRFGKFNKTKIDQYIETENILKDMGPVILCSDTNITHNSEEQYYLTNNGAWTDCWKEQGENKDMEYTYDAETNDNLKNKQYTKKYRNRMDRIIYKTNDVFKTVDFELVRGIEHYIEPSDHYGVMAIFEFK